MTLASASHTPNPDLHFATLDSVGGRRMSPQSIAIAVLCNAAILLLLLMVHAHPNLLPIPRPPIFLTAPMELPPPPPRALKIDVGDRGGSSPGMAPPALGNPPKFAPEQLSPPKIAVANPILAVDPTINTNISMAHVDINAIGMPNAPNVGPAPGNGGKGYGIGGDGPSAGPGHGAIGRPGIGGVSKPEVLFAPEPQFSEEARKQKVAGNVLVYLVVDASGHPTRVRVLRGIGLGLDEKAIEAVLQYKFKPAMQNGHPVPVEMNVDVNFQIF